METPISFGLLSFPVLGNLFNADFSHLALCKTENIYKTENNINIVVQIGATASMKEGAIGTNRKKFKDIPAENYDPVPQAPTDSSIPAPCVVRTTMVFNDARIRDFRVLNLGAVPLFVLSDDSIDIKLAKYSLAVRRNEKTAEFISKGRWKVLTKRRRYKRVTEFSDQPIQIPSLRAISQVCDYDGSHSATLYRATVGKEMIIAGQNCLFSRSIFDGLFLVVIRSHRDRNPVYVREIAMVAMPKDSTGDA